PGHRRPRPPPCAPHAASRRRHGTELESRHPVRRRRPRGTAAMASKPKPPFPPQDLEPPGLESRMEPAPRYRAESYRPAGKLEGKAALVTGGDSGIGRAVALIFAREGADVALVYLDED